MQKGQPVAALYAPDMLAKASQAQAPRDLARVEDAAVYPGPAFVYSSYMRHYGGGAAVCDGRALDGNLAVSVRAWRIGGAVWLYFLLCHQAAVSHPDLIVR